MDIKLKNNKKISFIIAFVLVMVATISFGVMYPSFKKRAADYYVDGLHSKELLNQLYQGSCVLYKDITEVAGGESVEYDELYLQFEEQTVEGNTLAEEEGVEFFNQNMESWSIQARERMNSVMLEWRNQILDGLAQEMDYCVIDHKTGKSIKNTGRSLEQLGTEQADQEVAALYQYYVRVTFDSVGNLEKVSVKSDQADELLKSVQSTMKSNILWGNFWSEMGYDGILADGSFFYYGDDGELRKGKTTVFSTPRDTTYVFALTQRQKERLLNDKNSDIISSRVWKEFYAYYEAGVPESLHLIMIILFVAALILPRYKKYCLHTLPIAKLHMELSGIAGVLLFLMAGEGVTILVSYTNGGYFNKVYASFLNFLPTWTYPMLTGTVNGCAIFVTLAVWYYLATCFGEISVIGIRRFVKERSLVLKCCQQLTDFGKRNVDAFKKEILHVDLGEKMNKIIRKLVVINFLLLAAMCAMWFFGWAALVPYSILLYFLLKRYIQKIQEQYQKLLSATSSIAEGNLQTRFEEDWGVFESYKKELAKIQDGFKNAVEEEVKSQKMKTELITNVSHDLKTPLTAITTYIELLEDEGITAEQKREYLDILKKKAARLKFLIEDLFEVSKASTGNVTLKPVDVDICNLMRQVYLEYEEKVEESGLIFRFRMPEEKVILRLDSQKTYRVFENLYVNIIKYAMPHTRVYVDTERTEKGFHVELKNMSATELNILPENLKERFVRGDSSRNTEGSGLGLAIANSFVELQGGKMKLEIDGDLFKVIIDWQQ